MLRRLSLKDFVIVDALDLEFGGGFSVLTGETGAGKSILVDALQLALGARGDAGAVREGCARSEIVAEFDSPPALAGWLDAAGFDVDETLLLRRVVDAQGKSRAFVNGSAATVAQLREAADQLIDIHGQHAWQSLTRPAAVRALLDAQAGAEGEAVSSVAAAHARWSQAVQALADARARQGELANERERLAWQVGEVDRLAPAADEWETLNADHQRLAHAQSLIDAAQAAQQQLADADTNAIDLLARAAQALAGVSSYDPRIAEVVDVLASAQAQAQDAARSLSGYLGHADLDPERLAELDERMSSWMSLARRFRRAPEDLPALWQEWKDALAALDAASDLEALRLAVEAARAAWAAHAKALTALRAKAAPEMGARITEAMQQLGMGGGRFEVALVPQPEPQSYGAETVEFLVAGHEGSTPRPLAKVASGGELSRLALAIAVTAAQSAHASSSSASSAVGTLIFDEIDAGVGGTVADAVGRLMKRLGTHVQVLAVTHLPQVAACGDHHFVVAKQTEDGRTTSRVTPLGGEARVAEVARMLGGERSSGTSLAHAQELIAQAGGAGAPVAGATAAAPRAPVARTPRPGARS
jgi:DNA repair protein RecN (Recombination protein N)